MSFTGAPASYRKDRDAVRQTAGDMFFEIYLSASPEVCALRDPKGHYRKAVSGEILSFTGVSAPHEPPLAPDLLIDTGGLTDAWHRAERGEAVQEDHVTFASWDVFARVMTGKRVELLRYLHHHDVVSVAALARELKRDYKRAHADIEILATAGLVRRDGADLHTDYDVIESRIAL